jgi:hypothetical protein
MIEVPKGDRMKLKRAIVLGLLMIFSVAGLAMGGQNDNRRRDRQDNNRTDRRNNNQMERRNNGNGNWRRRHGRRRHRRRGART